jgi:hypothetical protein
MTYLPSPQDVWIYEVEKALRRFPGLGYDYKALNLLYLLYAERYEHSGKVYSCDYHLLVITKDNRISASGKYFRLKDLLDEHPLDSPALSLKGPCYQLPQTKWTYNNGKFLGEVVWSTQKEPDKQEAE